VRAPSPMEFLLATALLRLPATASPINPRAFSRGPTSRLWARAAVGNRLVTVCPRNAPKTRCMLWNRLLAFLGPPAVYAERWRRYRATWIVGPRYRSSRQLQPSLFSACAPTSRGSLQLPQASTPRSGGTVVYGGPMTSLRSTAIDELAAYTRCTRFSIVSPNTTSISSPSHASPKAGTLATTVSRSN
jgi:hypothetical protein